MGNLARLSSAPNPETICKNSVMAREYMLVNASWDLKTKNSSWWAGQRNEGFLAGKLLCLVYKAPAAVSPRPDAEPRAHNCLPCQLEQLISTWPLQASLVSIWLRYNGIETFSRLLTCVDPFAAAVPAHSVWGKGIPLCVHSGGKILFSGFDTYQNNVIHLIGIQYGNEWKLHQFYKNTQSTDTTILCRHEIRQNLQDPISSIKHSLLPVASTIT